MSAVSTFGTDFPTTTRPAAPLPRPRTPGFVEAYLAMRRNPITALSERAYEEPIIDLIRPGRALLVSDPAMIEHVLVQNAANYRKSPQQQRRLRPALADGLLTAEGETWRSTRRITAPLFSPSAVGLVLDDMQAATEAMRERWEARGHDAAPLDLTAEFQRLTYEIVSRTVFSGALDQDRAAIHANMAIYFDTLGRIDLASLLDLPDWWPTLDKLRAARSLKVFRSVVDTTVANRLAEPQRDRSDLLDQLFHASDPKTGRTLDNAAVSDNVLTFLAAGHETTGNALAWIFYLLALHPEAQDQVRAELQEICGDGAIDRDRLDRLEFTKAVINETLRLYPPVPFMAREAIDADDLNGQPVRKGMQVVISPWVVHRHRTLWDAPDAFRPERFLGEAGRAIARGAFLPFGLGPRICIGQRFAVQEMLTVVAAILPHVRYDLVDPGSVFPQARITLTPKGGLPAFVRALRR
ncbi:cytochrome P450 [Amorphus sp. MBR-141]